MSLTVFFLEPGTLHGRIAPALWTAPEGDSVLGLGADREGVFALLNTGDFVEWSQDADIDNAQFMRMRVYLRPPAATPAGAEWRAIFRVDLTTVVTIPITAALDRDLFDVVLNTGAAGVGNHILSFRLELAATGGALTNLNAELPGFYVDGIVQVLAGGRPQLANRTPEPNETGVPPATHIQLDIQDHDPAGGIDLAATKIYVEDVLAFDGGTFQAGFNGPSSAHTTVDGGVTRRITIDPQVPFESLQVVDVHVVTQTTGTVATLDQTYAFTIADLTAPRVTAAMGVGTRRVRVSFDESMLMVDSANANDALNPANYQFTAQSAPAVAVEPVGVVASGDSAVEILLDTDMTPGASYLVTVTSAEDLFGNVIVAPFNSASFVAFTPPVPAGRRWDLLRMLPRKNRDEDAIEFGGTGDLRRFISCLQEIVDLTLYDIDRWTDILDPDSADEAYVDLMLWGLGNPFEFELSLADKRRLLRVLVSIYRLKGTVPGIVNTVRFFVGVTPDIEVVPATSGGWILGDSELGVDTDLGSSIAFDLYSFEIVSAVGLTDEQRSRITKIANYMKAAHEHLVRIVEPTPPPEEPDHLELGLSELGVNWELHG